MLIYLTAPQIFKTLTPTSDQFFASLFLVSRALNYENPLIFVGWTLEYEMLFYLLFAIGILLPRSLPGALFPAFALVLLVTFTDISPIAFEFILGMLAAFIFLRYPTLPYAKYVFLMGWALFFASIPFDPEMGRLLKWGVPSFLIVLTSCYLPQLKSLFLKISGDASYSIYLIQIFTIPAFYKVLPAAVAVIPNDITAIVCLATSIGVGIVIYYTLEKALTHIFRNPKVKKATAA